MLCANKHHKEYPCKPITIKTTKIKKETFGEESCAIENAHPNCKAVLITSCIIISFWCNWVSSPLACTTSRFCHKLSARALFLSCSCNTGGEETLDPANMLVGLRCSRCRLCSISCFFDVSRYS